MLSTAPEVDLLVSGITPTAAREKAWGVRFSQLSCKFHQALLTRKGEPALEKGELVPVKIGAAANTTNADFLQRLLASASDRAVIEQGPKPYLSLINALESRRVDGFLVDEVYLPTLYRNAAHLEEQTSVAKLRPEDNGKFELSGAAYGFRPEDRIFREAMDEFLKSPAGLRARKELQTEVFPELEFVP